MEQWTRRDSLLGGLASASNFWMPPSALGQAARSDLCFFTLGDWGRHGRYHQRDVARAMHQWAFSLRPSFIMTVGDNFYQKGVGWPFERHWVTSWEAVYHDDLRELPWVPAMGNHDYWGSITDQIRYRRAHPSWYGYGSSFYVFKPWANPKQSGEPNLIDIFVLDTSALEYPYFSPTFGTRKRDQKAWLEEELLNSTAEWKLIFGHHAVFSGGDHGRSKVIGDWLQGVIERCGVQAYVCGHDHDLQHFIAGHEKAPHYILTGGGSKVDGRRVVYKDGAIFQAQTAGFTAFRIQGERLLVDFIDSNGRVLHQAQAPKLVAEAPPIGSVPKRGEPARVEIRSLI